MMVQVDEQLEMLKQELESERQICSELERELNSLHQFIRSAGHDLKTPITTLKTSLYLLQRKPEMASKDRLSMMEGQLDRLSNLVEAMGLMARLDGKTELVFDETDILAIIHEALWGVKQFAEGQNITISLELPEKLPELALNFEECKRALVNLLDNAIRYSPENGQVEIVLHEMHEYLCVDIRDRGIGLSEDDISHVFQHFYRGDDAGNIDNIGAGMGLPIVKRIVDLHGGKMRVDSVQGEGSTFRMMLPVQY